MKISHNLPGITAQLLILAFIIDLRNCSVFKKGAHDEHEEYRLMLR